MDVADTEVIFGKISRPRANWDKLRTAILNNPHFFHNENYPKFKKTVRFEVGFFFFI